MFLQTLFTAGLGKPEDIVIDYITGNIYFSDNDYQHIAVCSNDGYYCKAIITENVHRPRGIALYPQKGKIYWTDWGSHPMIATASMDGSNDEPLITKDIHWPNSKFFYANFSLNFPSCCKARASIIDYIKLMCVYVLFKN